MQLAAQAQDLIFFFSDFTLMVPKRFPVLSFDWILEIRF